MIRVRRSVCRATGGYWGNAMGCGDQPAKICGRDLDRPARESRDRGRPAPSAPLQPRRGGEAGGGGDSEEAEHHGQLGEKGSHQNS